MKSKVLGGVALVLIGILLLLVNLGYLSFNIFFSIFNLWPLILIVIGINILFKKNVIVSYITWGLVLVIIILYGIFSQGHSNLNVETRDTIVVDKYEETKFATLNLDLGASKINIDSTMEDLLSVDIMGRPLNYKEDYNNNFETAIIDIETRTFRRGRIDNFNSVYDFSLNKNVIWDIDFDLGAISGEINLEDIPVRRIELDSGAADLTFILGNKHDLDFEIDTGASNINIAIPQDVGLRIDMDSALSSSNIKDMNLINKGDYYISQNYDDANTRINLDIDMGLGSLNFSYR